MNQPEKRFLPKKALFFGAINAHVRRLEAYFKGALHGATFWHLECCTESSLFESLVKQGDYDLIMLDVSKAPLGRLDIVDSVCAHAPHAGIIAVTSHYHPWLAQLMMSGRVHDVMDLCQEPEEVAQIMTACHARRAPKDPMIQESTGGGVSWDDCIGGTMSKIASRIPNIVSSALSCVHITGESGTGKEVVAQMFREAAGHLPFVAVNCAAIPESLLESVLFGSIKGSFTGSTRDQMGYFEAANGGWIFLDEVACLSKSAQAALLRAIENQEVMRLGENFTRPLTFRVISATNAPLRNLAMRGEFRLDLYHRLAEVELNLPPLRERLEEVPSIIDSLVKTLPGGPYRISPAAKSLLEVHSWSEGNVRQLRNCLRAMTEFQMGGFLTPQGIPRKILEEACAQAKKEIYSNEKLDFCGVAGGGLAAKRENGAWSEGHDILLQVPTNEQVDFERLTLQLFMEVAKLIGARNGRFSTRLMAEALGMSKSTISRKINEALELGIGDLDEMIGASRSRPWIDERETEG